MMLDYIKVSLYRVNYTSNLNAVYRIANKIIELFAQVENLQVKFWVKKPFVVETQYCMTLNRMPEELWDEILQNEAQLDEWRHLYGMNPHPTKDFLREHPTLVVDTRHFSEDFKWRLLAHFDDLDEALDGLLIKSENFQALNLLMERYRGQVKCVYIDPPYNTETNPIIYKNDYRHSSWLSLIESRLLISRQLETKLNPVHVIAIDDAEKNRLGLLLERIFEGREITYVSVVHNPSGTMGMNFSVTNEYALFIYDASCNSIAKEKREDTPDVRDLMNTAKGSAGNYLRSTGKTCFYPIYVKDMAIIGVGDVCPDDYHPSQNVLRDDGVIEVYPIDADGVERKWVLSRDTIEDHIEELYPEVDKKSGKIRIKRRKTAINYKTVWDHTKYSAKKYGTELLGEIIPETRNMARLYPKSVHLVMDCIHAGCTDMTNCLVADYFAGSGTTAHAVINLNREDGGRRKYILVEMGDYFETVLLKRIKKVVYSDNWKDGKPQKGKGISHFFKYLYLEQYEDTLNNLELTTRKQEGQLALKRFGDGYLLRYMLDFETQGSPSLLNLKDFQDPFNYKIKMRKDKEIRECVVDLVETFNYLLGIHVKKMRQFQDNERLYRAVLGEKHGKFIVIVWRPLNGLNGDTKALQQDRHFIEYSILPALLGEGKKPDRLLVNGTCYVPEAELIEPEFIGILKNQ